MSIKNLESLAARTIEQRIGKQLQSRYSVIMTANIETDGSHGPRMEGGGGNGKVVLADMQIHNSHRHMWLEIKTKNKPNYFHTWHRDEHGIDKYLWEAYLDLQQKTCMSVGLLISELSSGELLIADLNTLQASGQPRIGKWLDGKDSINWNRRTFTKVGVMSIKNDDLTTFSVAWDWSTMNSFLRQLGLWE